MTAAASAAYAGNPDSVASFTTRQLHIGQAHYAAGEIAEAIVAYQRGLVSAQAAASDELTPHIIPELHAGLGNAFLFGGELDWAAANFKAALRLNPQITACWCNLGNVQLQLGRHQDAISLYLQALKLNPRHWASRTNLVQAVMATKQYIVARAVLLELIDERPQDAQLHHQLGKTCFELNELDAALAAFERAVALDPDDADSLYWIGGLQQENGHVEAAQAAYAKGAQIRPLIRRPAVKSPPDFRVLALYAPFAGNTPTEYIFKDAVHDTDTLALFTSGEHDAERLKQNVDVVVNLVSDADQGEVILPVVSDLVARIGKPVVNDPGKIQRTTRNAVAMLLTGIEGCRIPKALRLKAGADISAEALRAIVTFSFPVLARPVGTHGGDDFEKIENVAELSAFLAQHNDHDHYLIEYIDFGSRDGHFRKYRFMYVDGQILPYHLAIGNEWKVHHINTDMAHQIWMQQEEQQFLDHPSAVFNPAQYRALEEIRRRIELDYFGIDCGLDAAGNIVVFEVNASMLVHERNDEFPYKNPAVRRIKQAFDAMLRKFALG
jgi:tetratricopeptide (TPR) repeat protein/glutathione synthase/RimK-type ligase-like ATP-grasp enzyme